MFIRQGLIRLRELLSVQFSGASYGEKWGWGTYISAENAGKRRTGFVVDYLSGYHKIAARCIFLLFDGGDYLHVFYDIIACSHLSIVRARAGFLYCDI